MSRSQRGVRRRTTLSALNWARKLWQSIDSAVSLSCTILDRYGEYEQLVRKTCTPSEYADPLAFFADYQSVKALSSYPDLKTGIDTTHQGRLKFLEAEVQCAQTNDRLFNKWREEGSPPSSRVNRVLYMASRKIAAILGDVPSLESLDFRFGPGACFGTRGDTSAFKKLTSPLECTFAQSQICSEFLSEFPGWIPDGVHSVLNIPGSELSFVPKNAKTDRPICIEPLLNGLMQKGIGSYISSRLRHFGVDLSNQEINQDMARRAYSAGLSTVDFSSASDTIAYALVLDLLPIDWVEFLSISRSPCYLAEGRWYDFHKWSSMGNAYTFELETLIFFSLASACCDELGITTIVQHDLHVYGDDVILPREAFDLFLEVTQYCGFSINTEKSYRDGVFFESCGADWFLERNVRPILMKRAFKSTSVSYYAANSTLEIAKKFVDLGVPETSSLVKGLLDLHADVVGSIPRHLRVPVPYGSGHGGLWAAFDVAVPSQHDCWEGFWYVSYVPDPPKIAPPLDEESGTRVWPQCYALYWAGTGTPHSIWDKPSEQHHSDGYVPRPKNPPCRRRKLFWPGDWPNTPVLLGDRSVRLIKSRHRKADAPPARAGVRKR